MNDSRAEVLIVGSGIAGLATALSIPDRTVCVFSRGALARDGSSHLAQGGMAAALGEADSPASHAEDTLRASQGRCRRSSVEILTRGAAETVHWLQQQGVDFDCRDGGLALGREAAHSHPRIVHAGGDATGAAIMSALSAQVSRRSHIEVREHCDVLALESDGETVRGLWFIDAEGRIRFQAARQIVLACGGSGGLFEWSTSPRQINGAGIALALKAGARLADLEFVQFHPTALAVPDGPSDALPLVTEALRGAGALLVDETGHRFMAEHHPSAELAPRNIVASAIHQIQQQGHRVFLDARSCVGADFPRAFPTVYAACRTHGIDPVTTPIPVTPAAHYHMGGVWTDDQGHSSLDGLWACGETASSGVHGANRLASNSLLEGVVFGRRIGMAINELPSRAVDDQEPDQAPKATLPTARERQQELARILWRDCGLVRSAAGLGRAIQAIESLSELQRPGERSDPLDAGLAIVRSALRRRHSIGAHCREDEERRAA